MSRTVSPALLAHYAGTVTTIARCWKCTRLDNRVFGFTNVDQDVPFGGVTYLAATGIVPSALEGRLDLSVPNTEVHGFLDSSTITEADLLAGLWDGCVVEIFEVNYKDLTMGRMVLTTGTVGNVSAGLEAFTCELRDLAQALQQSIGEVYAAACPATLGDARCTKDLTTFTVTGAVTAVNGRRIFTDSARAEADDYFGAGLVTWLTGANAGASMEVAIFAAGLFTLCLPMAADIAVGDTYRAVAGCRKRRTEDCSVKFNNVVNFRGFPDVPLNDKVLGNATAPP